MPYSTTAQMNQAIADALLPSGGPAGLLHVGPNGRRHRGGHRPLLHLGRNGCRHRGGAAEQRPDLERRADVQPAAGQQRAAEPVGGRRPDRQLPEPGRHDPHRIATPAARPTRKRKRAQRSPPPSTPWTCPNSRTRRRSRPSSPRPCRPTWRASWPTTQLGDLGHLLGPVQLRRQQPGRFQDHHGSVGFLHPDQKSIKVLPSDRAGFPAHGHLPAVLDQLANPDRDRRRHRLRGLPHPSAGRHAAVSANGSFESLVRTNVTPPSSRTPRSSSPAPPTPRRKRTGAF